VVGGNYQQYHPLHETVENESRTSRTGQKGAALISLISEYNTRNSWMHICVTCIWEKKGWINSSQTNESSSSVWSGEFFLGKINQSTWASSSTCTPAYVVLELFIQMVEVSLVWLTEVASTIYIYIYLIGRFVFYLIFSWDQIEQHRKGSIVFIIKISANVTCCNQTNKTLGST